MQRTSDPLKGSSCHENIDTLNAHDDVRFASSNAWIQQTRVSSAVARSLEALATPLQPNILPCTFNPSTPRSAVSLGRIRHSLPTMELTICTGIACSRAGGNSLLEACVALGAADDGLTVQSVGCCGACPRSAVNVVAGEGTSRYKAPANTLETTLASAEEAITKAGSSVDLKLKEAWIAFVGARSAAEEGDVSAALQGYTSALEVAREVIADKFQPSQSEPEPESLYWEDSSWEATLGDETDSLEFCESATNYDFGFFWQREAF